MDAGLYIVGTPIGNLSDISLRAIDTLKEADLILAEDARCTRKLLSRYDIKTPLISCHKFNEASRAAWVTDKINSGQALALVCDSGMPNVSDPGSRIITACHRQDLFVTGIPGPSAVTAAMALSGFGSNGFLFAGFPPPKPGARRKRLLALAGHPDAVILFESPHRIVRFLKEMEEIAAHRPLFLGRELTKKFEETLWGTASALREKLESRPGGIKGEIVVVMAPMKKKDSGSPTD